MRTFAQNQNQSQKPVSSGLARPGITTLAEAREAGLTVAASSRFEHDFSRIPIHSPGAGAIQTKLAISNPGDQYEQEADRVAGQVMRMIDAPLVQRKCDSCEEENQQLQRKPLAESITPFIQAKRTEGGAASDRITDQINATKGSGRSMEGNTQSFMQSRFGADFSGVKIHTGDEAVQMNREMRAHAFTVGNNIFFNSGRYKPESESGKRLLAHELTHVVQQKGLGSVIQKDDGKNDDKPDTTPAKDKPMSDKISDDDLNTLAAIVATEANIGQEDDMEWVYFNLFAKGKASLNESTPFRTKADTFKFNKYLLDDSFKTDNLTSRGKAHFKTECANFKSAKDAKVCDGLKTISDVYSTNESYYAEHDKKRVKQIRDDLVNKFSNPASNPGFNSNGNHDDLNREDGEWPMVRAYLQLQEVDSKLPVLVKKLGAGRTFEVVYKKDQIIDFFKKNPGKLPKSVPQYP